MDLFCSYCYQEFSYDHHAAGSTFECSRCKRLLCVPDFLALPKEFQEEYQEECRWKEEKERKKKAAGQTKRERKQRLEQERRERFERERKQRLQQERLEEEQNQRLQEWQQRQEQMQAQAEATEPPKEPASNDFRPQTVTTPQASTRAAAANAAAAQAVAWFVMAFFGLIALFCCSGLANVGFQGGASSSSPTKDRDEWVQREVSRRGLPISPREAREAMNRADRWNEQGVSDKQILREINRELIRRGEDPVPEYP